MFGDRTQKRSWCVCMAVAQLTWMCVNYWAHGPVILDEMHLWFLEIRVELNKADQSLLNEHVRGREVGWKLNYSASLQEDCGLWIPTYLDLKYPLWYLLVGWLPGSYLRSWMHGFCICKKETLQTRKKWREWEKSSSPGKTHQFHIKWWARNHTCKDTRDRAGCILYLDIHIHVQQR